MRKSIFALLFVVFIDALGIGILFPILSAVIMNPQTHFVAYGTSTETRQLYYGITISIFFICWFVGAIYLAKTSDQIGRKRVLLICLVGLFIGYGLTGLAIAFNSLLLLIVGRVVGGITAGSQPIAQAAIIDVSSTEERTKNLGLIMFAFSLGLIAGPIIGGLLSDKSLCSWFNDQLPFYLTLILIAINILILLITYQDQTKLKKSSYYFKPTEIVTQFYGVFKNKNVLKLSVVFFLMQISFNTFYIFLPVYLYRKYHYDVFMNSLMMLVLGIAMAISTIFLVPLFEKHFKQKQCVIINLSVMAIMLFLLLINWKSYDILIFGGAFMLAFGVAYTNMLGMFSHSVSDKKQGWVMGVTVSLFTSGSAITSLFGEKLLDISVNLPFILAIIVFVLTAILLYFLNIGSYLVSKQVND